MVTQLRIETLKTSRNDYKGTRIRNFIGVCVITLYSNLIHYSGTLYLWMKENQVSPELLNINLNKLKRSLPFIVGEKLFLRLYTL